MIVNLNLLAFTQVNARVPSLANGRGLARNSAESGRGVTHGSSGGVCARRLKTAEFNRGPRNRRNKGEFRARHASPLRE